MSIFGPVRVSDLHHLLLIEKTYGSSLVKSEDSYYRIGDVDARALKRLLKPVSVREIEDLPLLFVLMSATIAVSLIAFFSCWPYLVVGRDAVMAVGVLIINVVFHELGHVAFLRLFCPKCKVSFGFKMSLPFPSFYVDTTDSYILPVGKRSAVYLGGLFANSLYVLATALFAPFYYLSDYSYLVVTLMVVNLLPLMKGDGFYFVLALRGAVRRRKSAKGERAEELLRGIATLVFIACLFMACAMPS